MQREDIVPIAQVDELLRAAFIGGPKVFEAYSEFESPTKTFPDLDALMSYVSEQRRKGRRFFHFSLHFPEVGGQVSTTRFALRPEKCSGATWREKTEGWGLIKLEIADRSATDSKFAISVNSETRAKAWAGTRVDLGDPGHWDWKAVERQARRLIRVLRRVAC